MIEINYAVTEDEGTGELTNTSPIGVSGFSYDLEPVSSLEEHKDKEYSACPAWQHKASRTFVVRSPIDIEIEFDTFNFPDQPTKVIKSGYDPLMMPEICFFNDKNKTLQFQVPVHVFWTKEKNVWIESKPYPTSASKNNFYGFSGWWELSSWNRPISFSVEVVDIRKPVIVRRGDPLFLISFFQENNLNQKFKLVRHRHMPQNVIDTIKQNIRSKKFFKDIIPKLIFGNSKKEESKCPFSFLYKK